MQDGSDSDDELPPVRQAFLQNGSQSRSAQQLEESDSEEEQPSRPAQPAAKTNAAAAGRSSKPAAPTRASGTSKPKPRAGSKALAPAASEGQEAPKGAPKRTASGKAHSQQQEPSGSTAGGSVAGCSPASLLRCFDIATSRCWRRCEVHAAWALLLHSVHMHGSQAHVDYIIALYGGLPDGARQTSERHMPLHRGCKTAPWPRLSAVVDLKYSIMEIGVSRVSFLTPMSGLLAVSCSGQR